MQLPVLDASPASPVTTRTDGRGWAVSDRPIDHTARFETVGDLYYRHSGRLRPGKSEPLVTNRDSSSPENVAAFDEYMATRCFGDALDRIAQLAAEVEALRSRLEDLEP